jgi:uncharacterized protein (UPF0332 family)
MDDERITAIREKVFDVLGIAEDDFESAVLLYESERYRTSIPLFKNSVLGGIKALLMLDLDELPDDSLLVDSFHKAAISKKIKLDIGLNEILKKLSNAEQDSIRNPLDMSKKSIKDLDTCYKHTENFLTQTKRLIRKTLQTAREFNKKKFVRKLTIIIFAVIAGVLILAKGIDYVSTVGHGLTGHYYSGQNFEKLIQKRIAKEINFDWGLGYVINNHSDNVSIRWTGRIKAIKSGEYSFITRSDDGARLWIDDSLIIDDWTVHAEEARSAKINLEKGYYKIKMEYFEGEGFASTKLLWIIPGKEQPEIIPSSYLRKVE